jgi:hypothetical protein
MKLKFQVSQTTLLDPDTIKGLIMLKLKDEEYRIQDSDKNSIAFDDDPWVMRWNFQLAGRLDGGQFEITPLNDSVLVTLKYYINLNAPAIIWVIISTFLVINGEYYAPLFLSSFYILAIFSSSLFKKSTSKDLLHDILNQ